MAVYWGADLNFVYNDAEREVLGDLHPGALGLPARELMRDSWDVVGPQLQGVMSGGETTMSRDEPLRFDRRGRPEVVYFTWSYSPLPDDDGRIGGVLLVSQDTTSRVLAERRIEALRDSAAGSMDAFNSGEACELATRSVTSGPDVPFALIYLLDADGSRAICAATSVQEGMRPTLPAVVELDRPEDEVAAIFGAMLNGRSEVRLTNADRFVATDHRGGALPRQAFVAAIGRGTNERVDGFMIAGVRDDVVLDDSYRGFLEMAALGVGRSVAAARAREAERHRAESIAGLDRAKTSLFSNASHELRTPLALIIGHLEALLDDPAVISVARASLSVAHRSALRMLKLVNALLDFSRIEAGEQIAVIQATDIARLTREITAMFESTAQRAGLRLTMDCPSLPQLVEVDPDAWERIVSNLISNALKFTPEGEIHVGCHAADGQLRLTVEDTGIGIAAGESERIFSRFYRGSDPRARTHEGSGIGLALVRELVQLHGGTIEAAGQPGEGTRMIVTLPLTPRRPDADQPADGRFSANAGRSTALFVAEADGWLGNEGSGGFDDDLQPTRAGGVAAEPGAEAAPSVLVAEDNSDMRAYLRRLLAPDFRVVLAGDGNDARRLALRHRPDLVISDAMMPGLDGFALIRELRRDSRTADLPVIIVSARADPESTLEALKLGA
ncbi:MAG: ATP-binding protein, partial [Solirubrobacteraceae bacterium]